MKVGWDTAQRLGPRFLASRGAAIRTGAAKTIKENKNGKACAKHPRSVSQ
jgi:hypothetical protein